MGSIPGRCGGNQKLGIDVSEPDGGPSKPDTLTALQSAKWDQLIGQLPAKALRSIDTHELSILVKLLCLEDSLSLELEHKPNDIKIIRVLVGVVDRVHRLSASFGLNPGDRKRLQLDDGSEDVLDECDRWELGIK